MIGAFNQEKALVGAFSVIVKTNCETDGALHSTIGDIILQNTKIFTATWYERACYYCGCCIIQNVIIGAIIHLCCCSLGEFVVPSV